MCGTAGSDPTPIACRPSSAASTASSASSSPSTLSGTARYSACPRTSRHARSRASATATRAAGASFETQIPGPPRSCVWSPKQWPAAGPSGECLRGDVLAQRWQPARSRRRRWDRRIRAGCTTKGIVRLLDHVGGRSATSGRKGIVATDAELIITASEPACREPERSPGTTPRGRLRRATHGRRPTISAD